MKRCTCCKEIKELIEFNFSKNTKDKLQYKCKLCLKRYREANIAKIKLYKKEQAVLGKNKTPEKRKARAVWYKNKIATDLDFKFRYRLRSRLNHALAGQLKKENTLALLGCSVEEFKTHIASKFTEDMTWENYGYYGWHLDHIIACAEFDLSQPEEQKKCFHYTNIQPLWAKDNFKKNYNRFLKQKTNYAQTSCTYTQSK